MDCHDWVQMSDRPSHRVGVLMLRGRSSLVEAPLAAGLHQRGCLLSYEFAMSYRVCFRKYWVYVCVRARAHVRGVHTSRVCTPRV